MQLPDQYEANARVNVDTSSILQPLLRGLNIVSDSARQVQLVRRTLLSRPNIEKLTRMTDLDLKATTPAEMEKLIDDLSADISISSAGGGQDLFSISFSHSDRQVAKRVVQSLLTIFVESTLGKNRANTDLAQDFVEQQIQEYENKLREAEQRLANFKRTHVGMMPGSGDGYYVQLQTALANLEAAKLALRESENRRDQLEEQMEEDAESLMMFTEYLPESASSLDIRIQELTTRLDELLLSYTEKHPDVIGIRRLMEDLELRRQDELEVMAQVDMGPVDSPVYQQMKLALAEADAQVASMQARVVEYQQRADKLQEMVDTIPDVEAEFQQLNRDYGVHQRNYQTLLQTRESARISEQAELTGDDLKFRVVDPPRVPLQPTGPNRLLFMSLILFAGLGAGIVLAFVLYQLRPTFDDARSIKEVTGMPVLGSVSMIHTQEWARKRRLTFAAFTVAVVGLLLMYGGIMAIEGLDLKVAGLSAMITGRG